MLVLTRRVNESITVGEDIEIKITRITGNKVRVGITAPRNIHVCRQELLAKGPQTQKTSVWENPPFKDGRSGRLFAGEKVGVLR